jgi:hypothetical protein
MVTATLPQTVTWLTSEDRDVLTRFAQRQFKSIASGDENHLMSIFADDLKFIEAFMWIPAKSQRLVPFVPTQMQGDFVRDWTGRDICIKPSQVGITSIVAGVFMKRTITTPNTTSVLISHDAQLTERLLHRAQVMYDSMPPQLQPRQDHGSATEKRFPDINSVMYIGTARAAVFGRGEPIHNLCLSENAFYVPEAEARIVKPAIERVPPGGTVVRESTPNGEQGAFFDEVQLALSGESLYNLKVIFWFEHPENIMPANSPLLSKVSERFAFDLGSSFDYTPEERILASAHNLSRDQIRWRRYKIIAMGDLFFQEQMEDLTTCFLASGQAFYDTLRTFDLARTCYDAPLSFEQAKVWEEPESGSNYIVGVDPGQGKITESVAIVLKDNGEDSIKHVATLAGLWEPHIMAPKVMALARYYNTALLVPESNSHGMGLVEGIKGYPRKYNRKNIRSGKTLMEVGWYTGPATKPYMMAELQRRLPQLETHDRELVRQVAGARELPNGRAEWLTASDYHDACCIGLMGAMSYRRPETYGFAGRSGWDW